MQETNNPGADNQSGWYKHEPTGQFVELINDAQFGTPLTNAFVKAGWKFVGEQDPRVAAAKSESVDSAPKSKK